MHRRRRLASPAAFRSIGQTARFGGRLTIAQLELCYEKPAHSPAGTRPAERHAFAHEQTHRVVDRPGRHGRGFPARGYVARLAQTATFARRTGIGTLGNLQNAIDAKFSSWRIFLAASAQATVEAAIAPNGSVPALATVAAPAEAVAFIWTPNCHFASFSSAIGAINGVKSLARPLRHKGVDRSFATASAASRCFHNPRKARSTR